MQHCYWRADINLHAHGGVIKDQYQTKLLIASAIGTVLSINM